MSRVNFLLTVVCLLFSTASYADWAVFGAGARCIEGKSFTVLATVKVSLEDPQTGAVDLSGDFKKIGEKDLLSCRIGTAKVTASISAFGPQGRGQCMGAGFVSIRWLTVNGISVFGIPTDFNWACGNSAQRLTKVAIYEQNGAPVVEVCRSENWDYDSGYTGVQCNHVSLVADAILSKTYKTVMARLPKEGKSRLRKEQREWLMSRDSSCRVINNHSQRHAREPLAYLNCIRSETMVRIRRLINN